MSKKRRRDDGGGVVWGRPEEEQQQDNEEEDEEEVALPDFGLSGALAKDSVTGNSLNGHVLKFTEPEDASKPKDRWRLYVFKGDDLIETLHIHRKSVFLVGRIKEIADVLTAHPSCSGQHAVVQYRKRGPRVIPYLMDLNSTNGTFLNKNKVQPARYIELRHKDVVKFGNSSRDYVVLDSSAED